MNTVKIVTDKKHRFNRSIIIKGHQVVVDGTGHAEVPEEIVTAALISGFELVDKSVKFTTDEERQHAEEVEATLLSAREQAKEIIAAAEREATAIIERAKAEVAAIRKDNQVDERIAKKEELQRMKVDELKALCADAGINKESYEGFKKDELIEFILSYVFDDKK